jgi:hypothetical protein
MFGWFAPKCPIDTREKAWTERRMLWLADRLGVDRMLKARVVVPTDEFFPGPYDGDWASARRCLDRMCGYMGIDPTAVTLEVLPDDEMPGAAGLYERRARSNICVAASQLASPALLLATLAHELAHELLLGGGLLTTDVADHEDVTDLLPVFLGTGVFVANGTIRDASGYEGGMSWWAISKQGYLPSRVLGYALALFAFVRGEERPGWADHLRTDAADPFRKGLRYLDKTGDSLFRPDTARAGVSAPTPARVVERLADRSPTVRLAALWDVGEHQLTGPDVLDGVQACLDDPDRAVREAAAQMLGVFGKAAAAAVPRLVATLWRGPDGARAGAAWAVGVIRTDPGEVIPALATLLGDENANVAYAAAEALARYGPEARPAEPNLLAAIGMALVNDLNMAAHLVGTLRAISEDPRGLLREHFVEDPELLQLALSELREQGG